MINIKLLLRVLLAVIVITVVISYSYYRTKDFVRGPVITISYPVDGSTVSDKPIEIVGEARNISYISINDRQIFTNEEGVFKEKLLLYPGYNIISIKASDKFDRDIKKIIEVIYKEKILDITENSASSTPLNNL
jgi:hypothetical protein